MFGFLKKKVTTRDIALGLLVGEDDDGIQQVVESLVVKRPEYAAQHADFLDEMQWLPKAAGLIAVRILRDHETSASVRHHMLALYSQLRNEQGHGMPEEDVAKAAERLEAYAVRFNRGLAFRPDGGERIAEAISDVANEAMAYFTGHPRATPAAEPSLIFELQRRTAPPDDLERHVAEHLGRWVVGHLKRLSRVRIAS